MSGYGLFISGGESRRYGVGFFVKENLQEKTSNFEAVSDIMCFIEFKDLFKITVINVCMPPRKKKQRMRKIFFCTARRIIQQDKKEHSKNYTRGLQCLSR